MAVELDLPAGTADLTPAQRAFRAVLAANLWDLNDPNVLPGLVAALAVPLTLTFDASGHATVATLAIGKEGRWGIYSSPSPIRLAHSVRERLIEVFGPAGE